MDESILIELFEVPLPDEVVPDFLAQWLLFLATRDFSIPQSGSGNTASGERQYNFGDPTSELYFAVESVGSPKRWRVSEVRGLTRARVEETLRDAAECVTHGDFGEDVTYKTTLSTADSGLDHAFFTHFPRILGDQRRIDGKRRLSDRVLLAFTERPSDPPQALLAPPTDIEMTLFVPGPAPGPLAGRTAAGMAEVVAAICTFALGRLVPAPLMIFPAPEDVLSEATNARSDYSIHGLARDSVSLDVFGDLTARGGADAMLRVRGALLAYQAAMAQSNADVATMLLVTAIEALVAPRPSWGKERVTKRFIEALVTLCPETVDAIRAHPNVEMALLYKPRGGERRQRQELLSQIYDLRSRPTHTGLALSSGGALTALGSSETMRVALLSDLARAALLGYLNAPQSFLTGHPAFVADDSPSSS